MLEGARCVLNAIGAWNSSGGANKSGAADSTIIQSQIIQTTNMTDNQKQAAANSFKTCIASNATFPGQGPTPTQSCNQLIDIF